VGGRGLGGEQTLSLPNLSDGILNTKKKREQALFLLIVGDGVRKTMKNNEKPRLGDGTQELAKK